MSDEASLREHIIVWALNLLIKQLMNGEVTIRDDIGDDLKGAKQFRTELRRLEILAITSEPDLRELLPELANKFDKSRK